MRNENKNKGNVLLIIIIVLLVVLISIGGVLVYRSYSNNNGANSNNINNDVNDKEENPNIDENNNSENSNNKDENVIKNLNMDSDLVDIIVNKLNYFSRIEFNHSEMGSSGGRFGLLYKKDKLLIKDLPAEIRMDYVVESFDLENDAKFDGINKYTIDKDKFKNKYIELMGRNVNIELVNYDWKCPGATIDDNNIIILMACGETWGPAYQIYKKYTKAEKNTDEIYLYEKISIVDQNSFDESNKVDVYSDLEHNKLVANNVEETEIFSSKYIDKFSEYKYTFKLEDGNYIFYSVEKVK